MLSLSTFPRPRAVRRALALTALALGGVAGDARAQGPVETPLVPTGAYVRALDFSIRDGVNGTVVERSPAALVLRRDDGALHTVTAENLRGLAVRGPRSRRYGFQSGLRYGVVAGALVGVAIQFAGEWFSDAPFADAGPQVIISTTGLAGAAIGGIAWGAIGRHRWTEVK